MQYVAILNFPLLLLLTLGRGRVGTGAVEAAETSQQHLREQEHKWDLLVGEERWLPDWGIDTAAGDA